MITHQLSEVPWTSVDLGVLGKKNVRSYMLRTTKKPSFRTFVKIIIAAKGC